MKKTLSILAIAFTVGLAGFQLANAGQGRDWRGGWGPCNGPNADPAVCEKWQTFRDDTADLRNELREKRRAYFDLMNGDKVDKEAAQALWSDMFDLKTQLKEKAAEAGLPARAFAGHRRGRHGCNGARPIGYFGDGPFGGAQDGAPCPGPADCPNRQ